MRIRAAPMTVPTFVKPLFLTASSFLPRRGKVDLEQLHDQERDEQHREEQQHRQGGADTEPELLDSASNRYIAAVQEYNGTVRRFPSNLTAKAFGYDVKPTFTVDNEAEISRPPQVQFDQ